MDGERQIDDVYIRPTPLQPNHKLSQALDRPVHSKVVNPANADSGILGAPVSGLMDCLNTVSKRYRDTHLSALSILLLEVETSRYDLERGDVLSTLLLPRRNGTFNLASRYKKNTVGPSQWRSAIDGLCRHGFLELVNPGYRGKDFMAGLSSAYRPTSKLYAWLDDHRDSLSLVRLEGGLEQVVLKSQTQSGKKLRDYEDNDFTNDQRRFLIDLSALLRAQNIKLPVSGESLSLPPQDFDYQRIFNDDFRSGGRLYCRAQQLRSSERRLLCFNDRKTCEVDFTSHQPRLLYHLNGYAAPEDCYENPLVSRELMKKAMTRVLNCANERAAIATLSNLLADVTSDQLGPEPETVTPRRLLNAVYETHPILRELRSSILWKQLQFVESNLAIDIMSALANLGVACLGVHDSFVVEEEHLDLLIDTMNERYHQRLGFWPELKIA
jgi:hypothetical protein